MQATAVRHCPRLHAWLAKPGHSLVPLWANRKCHCGPKHAHNGPAAAQGWPAVDTTAGIRWPMQTPSAWPKPRLRGTACKSRLEYSTLTTCTATCNTTRLVEVDAVHTKTLERGLAVLANFRAVCWKDLGPNHRSGCRDPCVLESLGKGELGSSVLIRLYGACVR